MIQQRLDTKIHVDFSTKVRSSRSLLVQRRTACTCSSGIIRSPPDETETTVEL